MGKDKFVTPTKVLGASSSNERHPDVRQIHPDSCVVQCEKVIASAYGYNFDNEEIINKAMEMQVYQPGFGTRAEDIGDLLESLGIKVNHMENAHVFDIVNELYQGHKVIIGLDPSILRDTYGISTDQDIDGHAIIVSGVDTTDIDDVKINITDPATGVLAEAYPIDKFINAWKETNYLMISTTFPPPPVLKLPEMVNFAYDDLGKGHIENIGELPFDEFSEVYKELKNEVNFERVTDWGEVCENFSDVVNGDITVEEWKESVDKFVHHQQENMDSYQPVDHVNDLDNDDDDQEDYQEEEEEDTSIVIDNPDDDSSDDDDLNDDDEDYA
jgi:hypothetical protein